MPDIPLTVLMTVFNGGEFLRAAIESVLRQTFTNFEFLIIDDGSTDDSVRMIRSFADPRIVLHRNPENLGQSESLNVGLRLAQGTYVARIDADDIAFPRWLEQQWDFVKENPDCAVVSAHAVIVDEQGCLQREMTSLTHRPDMLLKALLTSPVNHGVAMLNRDVVLANGGYAREERVVADYGLWCRLLKKGYRLSSTNATLMAIRVHSRQSSYARGQDAYVPELTGIMQGHIMYMTGRDCSRAKAENLCRAFYCTETLSEEEFFAAVAFLRDTYCHFDAGVLPGEAAGQQRWLNRQLRSLFLKRIYFCIAKGEDKNVRTLARLAIKACGPETCFLIFIVTSFFRMPVLRRIPSWHELTRSLKTRIKFIGMSF